MRNGLQSIAVIVLVLGLRPSIGQAAEMGFIRGDSNGDREIDLSDSINTLNFLFLDGQVGCLDAADFDASAGLDLTDCISALNYLFLDGPEPSTPFPLCGLNPEGPTLGCESPSCEILDVGDSIWVRKPDGCRQCGECTAPTLNQVTQELETQGVEVRASKFTQQSAVCAGCACASGRFYTVLVSPEDALSLEGQGWSPAPLE